MIICIDVASCIGERVPRALGIVLSELNVAGRHSWHKESEAIVMRYDGNISLTITYGGVVLDGQGEEIGKAKPLPE